MPVYNAGSTLRNSLESIISQTYKNIELCIVNDCSTDGSLELIQTYVREFDKNNIKIRVLSHNRNQGVAAARNTGLGMAKGKYIYYVDADDTIDRNAIQIMVETAENSDLDIIGCEWRLCFRRNQRYMNQPYFNTPEAALQNIMRGVMRWNLWLFMVKRSLYEDNQIRFVNGVNMGEDLMVMMKLFMCAEKVGIVKKPLYNYYDQLNAKSLTNTYSTHHRNQVTANVEDVASYSMSTKWAALIDENLNFLKLTIKLPLLISDNQEKYDMWAEWWKESNSFAVRNPSMPIHTKFLQYCAYKRWWLCVKLYYRFVHRFVYGFLLK